jgi:PiT family inorganic phosphate transporter
VTSGIGGTMVSAGAGLQYRTISRIVMAWVFTLPVTILISAAIYYVLVDPRLGT